MSKTKIEWTEATWNPCTGCTVISPGCKNCYAKVMAKRLKGMGVKGYENGFQVSTHESRLKVPSSTKKSTIFFVNSMSDLFHKDVPLSFIKKVFAEMNDCPRHTFQVLTKRSDNLRELSSELIWSGNIWQGVSVESPAYYHRIDDLCSTDAQIKWLSIEPMLAAMPDLPLDGIDWVVVGGETTGSYSKLRPIQEKWVLDVRDQCLIRGVPFFFKQWGGINAKKKANGRLLEGRTWDEFPMQPVC
jgi:protein gp37